MYRQSRLQGLLILQNLPFSYRCSSEDHCSWLLLQPSQKQCRIYNVRKWGRAGSLRDGSPPVGSRDKAPVEGLECSPVSMTVSQKLIEAYLLMNGKI